MIEHLPSARRLLDWFLIVNLAFLALDIYVAHSANAFAHAAEWIPFAFSLLAPVLLLAGRVPRERAWAPRLDRLLGWCAVAIGVAGLLLHLEGNFFQARTLRSLVFTAPFVAPLSYAGLGLGLLLLRSPELEDAAWSRWVLVLALGGTFGNFVLSLADHAQNGFFHPSEWISVVASALGVGALCAAVWLRQPSWKLVCSALLLQVVVGVAGFFLHATADLQRPGATLWERFVYGAPVFAPLLFPNLALLGGVGVLGCWRAEASSAPTPAATESSQPPA